MASYIPLTVLKRKESDPADRGDDGGVVLGGGGGGGGGDRDLKSLLSSNNSIDTDSSDRESINTEMDVNSNTDMSTLPQLKSVGIFRLAAILFFMGYGGSYGVEGSLSTGPPHYVLLSFLIAPFVWALPEALVTAELSSALPNVGGNILWARKAFGNFFAWQSGFWALLSIPAAVGIFPVMFASNLEMLLQTTLSTLATIVVHLVMVVVICTINILGLKSVSGGNLFFSLIVLTPFFLLVVMGIAKGYWNWGVLTSRTWDGDIRWQAMATSAIWSCGGWTNGGQIAGEIYNPRKSFNFAILIVLGLTLTFSLLPLSIAFCENPQIEIWKKFHIGSWVEVAQIIGGDWLRFLMAFGAMFSALGEMNSSFCAQARLLHYLSTCDDFSFPRTFARLHKTHRTPYIAIITLGVISFVVSLLDFSTIMNFVVFLASISLIISFACLIQLRIDHPELERPFKVPFGKFGIGYACGVGIVISLFNIIIAAPVAQIAGACLVVVGIVLYYFANYIKGRFVVR